MVLGITKSSNGIHGDKEGRSAIKNKCYYLHLASLASQDILREWSTVSEKLFLSQVLQRFVAL